MQPVGYERFLLVLVQRAGLGGRPIVSSAEGDGATTFFSVLCSTRGPGTE
jgi:hypothetical protein